MTLTDTKAADIRRLSDRMSQREIAKLLCVSRGSVQNIVSGRWHPRRPSPDNLLVEDIRILGRCERCRRKILLPCLPCYLETHPSPLADDEDKTLTLDLNLGEERGQRYSDIIEKRKRRYDRPLIPVDSIQDDGIDDESSLEEQANQYASSVRESCVKPSLKELPGARKRD